MAAWWDRDTIRPLRRSIGKDRVLSTPEAKAIYSRDATEFQGFPLAVVLAETVDDIQKTVKFAVDKGLTITPRGAGSGLSGGSVPAEGSIVLSCENMKDVMQFDPDYQRITVQPGVTTQTVQSIVKEAGLFYPPDPASYTISTIGGNVAENAGGLRCFKYGVTSHYVLGIEYVDDKGEIRKTGTLGSRVFEPDLTPLLIGSEGTFGIFSQIELRLILLPEKTVTLAAYFRDKIGGFEATEIILQSGLTPSVMEYIDRISMSAAANYIKLDLNDEADSMLLIELDGDAEQVGADLTQIEKLLDTVSFHHETADNPVDQDRLWSLRRAISPSLIRSSSGKIHEDVAVPRSKLKELSIAIDDISDANQIKIAKYGHAGDGNLHAVFLYDKADSEQTAIANLSVRSLYTIAISLGGTISGEHGIGLSKREFLPEQLRGPNIGISKQVKDYFDPTGLFNPGKIFG